MEAVEVAGFGENLSLARILFIATFSGINFSVFSSAKKLGLWQISQTRVYPEVDGVKILGIREVDCPYTDPINDDGRDALELAPDEFAEAAPRLVPDVFEHITTPESVSETTDNLSLSWSSETQREIVSA